ncbi:MAG TPA: hypothetical protein VN376_03675 [Longilinea sp.]|nr:hypothetical protein [Longilinea sp.]
MKTLGFVGTAKNTGKTTTALHMLELVAEKGIRTALTSIGYDGENTDHVTGLPKPRYFAKKSMVIATAEPCLKYGTAEYGVIQPTGLKTILGEIMIAKVISPGYVVLAGPNRKLDIIILLDLLREMDIQLTFLDGALNRLAAMVLADGMILSTGAAFDERIDVITDHAAAMESLFHYPCHTPIEDRNEMVVNFRSNAGKVEQLPYSSVMDEISMETVAGWLVSGTGGEVLIPGVFSPLLFQLLLERYADKISGTSFLFYSPLNLLASGNPLVWQSCFAKLKELKCQISYIAPIPLHFITVNPFYPEYLQKTGNYNPAYVDKIRLLQVCREKIKTTPIVDILQPPHPDLLSLCGIDHTL